MNIRIAYTLARITPVEPITAIASFALKTPSRIRNSPTKFAEPGIASVARATIRNSAANTGARNAIPPMWRMSRLPPGSLGEQGHDEEQRATTARG